MALDGNLMATMTSSLLQPGATAPSPTKVYLFERESGGAQWQLVGEPRPAQAGTAFAVRLDLDGDTLAMGVRPASDPSGRFLPNAVRLFRRNHGGTNNWGELKQIPSPPEASGFGGGVSLDGDTLAVGAPQTDLGSPVSGMVYLFERNVGAIDGWGLVAVLGGSSVSQAAELGATVALDGNSLAAGAGRAVYVYGNAVLRPAGLGLQVGADRLEVGVPATVVATISGEVPDEMGAQGPPQGEVQFFLNGESAGTARLDEGGQATLTLPGLPQGVHELHARFDGSTSWMACESPALGR